MRRQLKYKSFSREYFVSKLPVRVLQFKRTKWLRVKKYLKRGLNNKSAFKKYFKKVKPSVKELKRVKKLPRHKKYYVKFPPRYSYYKKLKLRKNLISGNPFKTYVLKKRKLNLKFNYKEKVRFQRNLVTLYGKKTTFNFKNKNKLSLIASVWYKPFYMPYQLLWYINFVASPEEARKKVESKSILLNDKFLRGNFLLKRGDVLTINNNEYKYGLLKKRYLSRYLNIKSVVVDYYTQELVVTEDFKDLDESMVQNATPRVVNTKYLDL